MSVSQSGYLPPYSSDLNKVDRFVQTIGEDELFSGTLRSCPRFVLFCLE